MGSLIECEVATIDGELFAYFKDGNIDYYFSGGWFLWTSYYFNGTVDPRNLSAESGDKDEIINRLFIAYGTNSMRLSSLSF